MAVSQAAKTYLTNKLNKKQFSFDFLCMFRGLMMQTIKVKHWFNSECWNS